MTAEPRISAARFRRRTAWIVGLVVVIAVALLTAWAVMSARLRVPLHFWMQDGEEPMRIHRTLEGDEVPHWSATWVGGQLFVSRQVSLVDSIRSTLRMPTIPHGASAVELKDDAGRVRAWREFIVIGTSEGWLPVGEPDPSLAGRWSYDEPGGSVRELRADGTYVWAAGPDGRWGRSEDLIVVNVKVPGTSDRNRPPLLFVLAPDGRTMRSILGSLLRKVE